MNFTNNKYITTILSLFLIIFIGSLNKNTNIDIYNNILFKILLLLLIYNVIDKDYSLGILISICFIILDQISLCNCLHNDINKLDHSTQLEHYTQDFIIHNNII